MKIRLTPDERRELIIESARQIADAVGIHFVTHRSVALNCDVPTSQATVRAYFPSKAALKEAARNDPTT